MESSKSRYVRKPLLTGQKRLFMELSGLGRLEFDFREYLDGALARLREVRKSGTRHHVLDSRPPGPDGVCVYYPGFPVVQPLRKLEMDLWQWLLPAPYSQLSLVFSPPPGVEIRFSSEEFQGRLEGLHRAMDLLESHLVQTESTVLCVRTPAASACWLIQSLRHRITHLGSDPRLTGFSDAFAHGRLTADSLRPLLGVNSQYCELFCDLGPADPVEAFCAQIDRLVREPQLSVGSPARDSFASSYDLGL